VHEQIWIVLMASAAGFALWKGGQPERACAVAMVAAWLATVLLTDRRNNWVDPQWGVMAADLSLLTLLLWVALRANRFWPLWAAAFQLLGVITHVAIMADRTISGRAYYVAAVIWSYLVVIALAAGTWSAWRRRRLSPAS
jgi:hypothetical protein